MMTESMFFLGYYIQGNDVSVGGLIGEWRNLIT